MKTEGKAKNLIHSVVVDHYVDGRSLRFSNCYYYHCGFGGLGALKLTRTATRAAMEGLSGGEIRAV
jgi:hypothetical protein